MKLRVGFTRSWVPSRSRVLRSGLLTLAAHPPWSLVAVHRRGSSERAPALGKVLWQINFLAVDFDLVLAYLLGSVCLGSRARPMFAPALSLVRSLSFVAITDRNFCFQCSRALSRLGGRTLALALVHICVGAKISPKPWRQILQQRASGQDAAAGLGVRSGTRRGFLLTSFLRPLVSVSASCVTVTAIFPARVTVYSGAPVCSRLNVGLFPSRGEMSAVCAIALATLMLQNEGILRTPPGSKSSASTVLALMNRILFPSQLSHPP